MARLARGVSPGVCLVTALALAQPAPSRRPSSSLLRAQPSQRLIGTVITIPGLWPRRGTAAPAHDRGAGDPPEPGASGVECETLRRSTHRTGRRSGHGCPRGRLGLARSLSATVRSIAGVRTDSLRLPDLRAASPGSRRTPE